MGKKWRKKLFTWFCTHLLYRHRKKFYFIL